MRQCHHEVFLQVKIRGKTNRAQARMRWKLTLEILMFNADQELFETTHSLRSRIYSHKKASDFGFTNMSRSHGTLFTCYPRIGMSHWSFYNASINAILLLIHLVMSFYVHRQVEQMSYHIPSPTTELAMQQSWPRMTFHWLDSDRQELQNATQNADSFEIIKIRNAITKDRNVCHLADVEKTDFDTVTEFDGFLQFKWKPDFMAQHGL